MVSVEVEFRYKGKLVERRHHLASTAMSGCLKQQGYARELNRTLAGQAWDGEIVNN